MAFVSANEIHNGRQGSDEAKATSRTRVWRVVMDDPLDDVDAIFDEFVPVGTYHPENPSLAVSRRSAVNEAKSKTVWIVTLEYKRRETTENPLDEYAKISWSSEAAQELYFKDKNGNAILNSAGDYYEEGVKGERSFWTVKIKKNVAGVPSWIDSYRDAVNSASVSIDGYLVAARTAKVSGIQIGEWQERNGYWFRTLELTIKIRDTWTTSPADMGIRQFVDPYYLPCYMDDGKTVATKPVWLDGSGQQMIGKVTPATAVFNTHYIYDELPFSALPLE